MSDEGSPRGGGGGKATAGFSSVRSIWQERAKEVAGPPAPAPKLSAGRPSGGRASSGGSNAPPQSPSSRANAMLSQPQEAAGPFQQYGITFAQENTGVLAVRKVIAGSVADQAGLIFPGDALHEVNGMEVYKWPLDRVTPLASGDRAGTTLRLSLERVGFSEHINVELELGKGHPKPSPRLAPQDVAPPPMEYTDAHSQPLSARAESTGSPFEMQAQDYEDFQQLAPQPSLEDVTNVRDDMRANVLKRYKTRIQELSQNLEESQIASAQSARQVEELTRFLNEKDELLKELREAVSKLTSKLEESSRDNYELRRKIKEQGPADPLAKSVDDGALSQEVQRLKAELDAMKNQRDIAQMSSLPSDETSDMLRELKLQIIEKDAKVQDLEGKNASLKRNNVIQAVELQELHDHVAGMEKQKIAMQVQQFPALPPLQSVRESPYETPMDEDEKMKAILLADEVLQKAQDEIAVLKQKDERRMQLELWAEQSQYEIQRLRNELAERPAAPENGSDTDTLKRERDDLQAWSQKARSEIENLHHQLSRSKSQVDLLSQQLAGLDNLKAKTADLHKDKMNLEAQVQALRSELSADHSTSRHIEVADKAGRSSSPSLLDHPLMQNLGALDKKQKEVYGTCHTHIDERVLRLLSASALAQFIAIAVAPMHIAILHQANTGALKRFSCNIILHPSRTSARPAKRVLKRAPTAKIAPRP